ncbi:P68 family surface lipoprotein [Metamycoplasma auris]|uniref:MG185/MG260 protein n=1 Tax=Metamycoplasma auris TaxID=51363 RepID=A0A2W7GPS6_9BACT|nr:P80 family lipoprotein [Metamycoplasma auris]PZV99892.1 MG185/MG260 protein [Metamycoplasma auris]
MKKTNKVLLSLASVSILATPLLAASCNRTAKFDQIDDGILKIAAGFSEKNVQGEALKGVVSAYNDWLNKNPDKANEGYLPVKYEFLPNGYQTGPLTTKLAAKERKTFWNILLNYPTSASIIAQNSMNLALSDEEFEALGIADAFKDSNKAIGGNTKNEKWVVPLGVSSEISSINKVLVGKFASELKDKMGVKYEESKSSKLKSYIEYYNSKSNGKKSYVDKFWKSAKANIDENVKTEISKMNLDLSDEIFNSYEKLVKFAIAARKMYPKDLSKPILGIDSLATAINVMTAAKTKGDLTKGFITPSPEHVIDGGYDYSSFLKDGTSQNKIFKDLLEIIFEGIKTGAVWVGGGGAYGSNLLTKHNMAINIGSTAGYSHTYIDSDHVTINYVNEEKNTIDSRDIFTLSEGKEKSLLKFTSGKYTNDIYASNSTNDPGKHNKKFVSKDKADELINKVKSNYAKYKLVRLGYDKNTNQLVLSKSNGKIDKGYKLKDEDKGKVVHLGVIFSGDQIEYSLVESTLIKEKKLDSNALLNKVDADWVSAPLKGKSEDKNSVFVQGPSMVLIHANERENKATKLFVNWMFKNKLNSIEFNKTKKAVKFDNIVPIDAFNQYSSYISPSKSYFETKNGDISKLKLNDASKIAFENLKKISSDSSNYQTADDVASVKSDKLRDAIGSAGRKMVNEVASSKPVDLKDFLAQIDKLFK